LKKCKNTTNLLEAPNQENSDDKECTATMTTMESLESLKQRLIVSVSEIQASAHNRQNSMAKLLDSTALAVTQV
jgi:hypothetical protein